MALEFATEVKVRQASQTTSVPLPEGITVGEGSTSATKALHFGVNARLELASVDYVASDKPFSLAVRTVMVPGFGPIACRALQDHASALGRVDTQAAVGS